MNTDNTVNTGMTSQSNKMLASESKYEWTPDEIEGEIGTGGGGYNKEYKYFLKASPTEKKFQVIDNETDEILATIDNKIACVIYHGHAGYKLLVGHTENLTGDSRKWGGDDKDENKRLNKIVAVTYNSPFASKHPSRGNFDRGDQGQWIDSSVKREVIAKRQYVLLLIPTLIANGTLEKRPILASFGGSSIIPFSKYFDSVALEGSPSFMLNSVISYESDTNKNSDDPYNKVVFDFEKNDSDVAYMNMMFMKDPNETDPKKIKESDPKEGPWGIRLRKRLEAKHMEYILAAENGEMAMAGNGDSDSNTIETTATTISQQPEMEGLNEPFNDDIPF